MTRALCTLAAALLLWAAAPEAACAETRNIYVGDIITLSIEANNVTADELREEFRDFDVIEIKEVKRSDNRPDDYLVSIRAFNAGEYTVTLGDTELSVHVHSTLEDIHRDDIFEGDNGVIEPGILVHWRVVFCVGAGIFALSGGYLLLKAALKRRTKTTKPLRLFLRRVGTLNASDDGYFVDLTFYFKEYIGSLYQRRIIGKTSGEIVSELTEIQTLDSLIPRIRDWLYECDRLKFTGVTVTDEEKKMHCEKLITMAECVDTLREAGT